MYRHLSIYFFVEEELFLELEFYAIKPLQQ